MSKQKNKMPQNRRVTDTQILALKAEVDLGKNTITQGCKELQICPKTYYNRMAKLKQESQALHRITDQQDAEVFGSKVSAIMREYEALLIKEMDRLAAVESAEAVVMQQVERIPKGKGREEQLDAAMTKYQLVSSINKNYQQCVQGVKATLNNMAQLERSLQVVIDQRQQYLNVSGGQDHQAVIKAIINELMPCLCDGCQAKVINQATNYKER